MAKLEGVKTLKVESGETTKIEYNGEFYEKVANGTPDQIGDIVAGVLTLLSDEIYFFKVVGINDTEEHEGTGMFYDEDGDYNGFKDYDTFRKVDTSLSGLKKVDAPVVGGYVVFGTDYCDVTAGEVYEIIRTKDSDNFTIIDDVGDDNAFSTRYAAVTFYVKAEEPVPSRLGTTSGAKAGDIVEMTSDCLYGDYHEGEQFVVKDDGYGGVYIDDNDGDARYIDEHSHLKYKIVALAEVNTDEEEAPMLAPLFAKVNRPNNEPIVGDFIELDPKAADYSWLSEDKKYEIIDIDEDGDFIFSDDVGEEEWTEVNDIKAIYVKYTQSQAEQKAKVGDKVLIVDEDPIHTGYGNGDIVTVKDLYSDGDINGKGTGIIFAEEYIVLNDAQLGDSEGEEETEEEYVPQEGDIVVITRNTNSSCNKVGDIGKVGELLETSSGTKVSRVCVEGRESEFFDCYTLHDEMRPATDEEKAEYLGETEEVASAQSEETPSPYGEISVGDKVKVVVMDGEESEHGWGRVNNGDIGTVVDNSGVALIVDFPNQKNWFAEASELIKVAENGDLLPGTVVKGNISDKVITLWERDFDRDRSYGTAYLVKDNAPFWIGEEQFEILTKEEAKKHVDVAEEDEAEELIPSDDIPIGTIVKVVQKGNGHYGETLRVTKNDGSGIFRYSTERLDGGFADVYGKEHLEVIEEPTQDEKIEVGDLVKVISSPNALPEGSYFIVKEVSDKGYVYSTHKDGTARFGGFVYMSPDRQLELIAKADEVYA